MVLNFELKIEQAQKIVMSFELQQAINLLQFSTLELADYLQQEITDNPLLEILEREDQDDHSDNEREVEQKNREEDPAENTFEWEEYFQDYEPFYANRKIEDVDVSRNDLSLEYYACQESNLQEHLLSQLRMSIVDKTKYLIGEYLIGNLDSKGYLQGDIADHAKYLGVEEHQVLEMLALIQSFEPTGVGARNLSECLLLQIRARKKTPPFTEAIVRDYLPEVGQGKYREIALKLGIGLKDLQEAVDFIKTLNPRPGSYFGGTNEVKYIIPDVIVEKVQGEYVVIVNDNVPHLVINPFYKKLLRQAKEENVNNFLKKRLESALWLIRSIEQRRLTLYKVTEQIIQIQRPFLEKGIRYFIPLTLKDVADKLGIHESTVSRATANKYVQTPRGLYALKFFFSGGIEGAGGEVHSVLSIKSYLKELIAAENSSSPYSDQQIAELFKQKGIQISRRTITKYRKELGTPASFKRRRIQ